MIKGIKYVQHCLLNAALIIIVAPGLFGPGISKAHYKRSQSINMQLVNGELSSLKSANAWINSAPLTSSKLKGKVVLIQFCTYTCINWLRTLPYVRAWAERYKDKGLIVIGVHSPEFPFENNVDNVRRAIKDMRIDFPVAIDNNKDIWNAFNNQYWPALYIIDSKRHIRHHQFGEGGYEQSEKIIQQLLGDTGAKDLDSNTTSVNAQGIEVAADWINLRSLENYLGYERTENFISNRLKYDKPHIYAMPLNLVLNQWALSGDWKVQKQSILLNKVNGKIVYRFHSRDLHLVMGPTIAGDSVIFRVLINGKPPGKAHGIDIDEKGNGKVTEQRLYQLIRQPTPITDCEFEIEFFNSGVEAFAFTFG